MTVALGYIRQVGRRLASGQPAAWRYRDAGALATYLVEWSIGQEPIAVHRALAALARQIGDTARAAEGPETPVPDRLIRRWGQLLLDAAALGDDGGGRVTPLRRPQPRSGR